MKKRTLGKKLSLRKDTLSNLGQDAMGQVRGGTSGDPICDDFTENAICVATTLAPHCAQGTENECGLPTTGGTCSMQGCGSETQQLCFSIPVCYP